MTRPIYCRGPAHKRAAFLDAWNQAHLFEGAFEIVIREAKSSKSREQEKHYHELIGQIAASRTLYGKRLPAESWKRLLLDAFKHETRNDPQLSGEWAKFGELGLLPALNHDGFVAIGNQSRRFSVKLASAFIEWLLAFQQTEDVEVAA